MDLLKLVALDNDDLEVVSAHVQDSIVKVGDIMWRPAEKRVVVVVNRFDWEERATRRPAIPPAARGAALRARQCLQGTQCRGVRQAHAAQSARRRVRHDRGAGRPGDTDVLGRRGAAARRRMPGSASSPISARCGRPRLARPTWTGTRRTTSRRRESRVPIIARPSLPANAGNPVFAGPANAAQGLPQPSVGGYWIVRLRGR